MGRPVKQIDEGMFFDMAERFYAGTNGAGPWRDDSLALSKEYRRPSKLNMAS